MIGTGKIHTRTRLHSRNPETMPSILNLPTGWLKLLEEG